MKVLFINTNDTSGGAARAAVRIMRGVQQCGIEAQMFVKEKNSNASDVIDLYNFVPKNLLYRVCDWAATKLKNKWQHHKWHPYKQTKQNVYMSDARSTYVHGALQKMDYDIVHLHWINNRFIDIRELTKIHKPIVWTLHDSWPFCGICHYFLQCEKYEKHCGACPMLGSEKERDLAYEVFEKKLAAYYKLDLHIVTPSRWLGECAKRSALLGRFPVSVIPNCLDTDLFRPLCADEMLLIANQQQNVDIKRVIDMACKAGTIMKPIFLYGAMSAATDPIKGFSYLLSALQILDRQGYEAQLVVFGAEKQDLFMQFEHIEITFLGYLHDSKTITALYSAADLAIVPSLTENLSYAIMESLSCGTPVVAFNVSGNGDLIEHQQNGYLAQKFDCDDLANGIQWCIEHNGDGSLGRNARDKVLNNYTISSVSEQYYKLYQSL